MIDLYILCLMALCGVLGLLGWAVWLLNWYRAYLLERWRMVPRSTQEKPASSEIAELGSGRYRVDWIDADHAHMTRED